MTAYTPPTPGARARLLALSLLFAIPTSAMSAAAQPAPAPAPADPAAPAPAAPSPDAAAADADLAQKKQQAKDHFLKGLEFVQNESWDAALAEFLASRDLYPTRVALENAAVCLRQLKRYAPALDMYEELLAKFGSSLPPDKLKNAKDAVAQLQGYVAQITVTADQAGSNVVVDGQERGKTPLPKPLVVNAGTHTVRVSKAGFETYEMQLMVAGRQTKAVVAQLTALRATGTLSITESGGQKLDVVVDGAVVGQTPWSGALAVGTHTVFLRGDGDIGTPPSSALVKKDGATTLALSATKLDAAIRVEPTPSNAQVDIDGVSVGNGVWEGRLTSGKHRLEIAAEGFVPYRRDVAVRAGQRELQRVSLERDLSNPMWQAGFVPHIYVEVVGGAAWATSLGGGADRACSGDSSCNRSRPLGFLAGARGGYEISKGLGVELFLGALYMKEKMTRTVVVNGEYGDWTSSDYTDSTQFFGPAAAASASYRFLDKTPLTLRFWAGAARVNATFSNGGNFTGTGQDDATKNPVQVSTYLTVPEQSARVWMPFVGPEVRIGYSFSKHFSVDIGAAMLLFFPPDTPRTGNNAVSHNAGDRLTGLTVQQNGKSISTGLLKLPRENGFGTYFAVMPTLAGRFDF